MIIPGFRAVRDWLARAPVEDPVDRLNAPFMQVLLMAFGVVVPFNQLYALIVEPATTWSAAQLFDTGTDGLITLAAWAGVLLIRRGRYRLGIELFLWVMLLSAATAYALTGYSHAPPDPAPLILMATGGIVLGRRTLWSIYVAVIGLFALGQLADGMWLAGQTPWTWNVFHALPLLVSAYLLAALILDRSITALRAALDQSIQRGAALALANTRLQDEIVERERTQNQLIHSQKMDAVGRIASGLAHDFDNVLNVVLGYASQREQLADLGTTALLNALEGIELAALRALTISRKLLNFSRQDTTQTQVFDAATALDELEPMLRQLLGRYIQLDITLRDHNMPILLDRGQFELMILNIAANARDAMPDGGRFSLILEHDLEHDPERDAAKPVLLLSLIDTGVGMGPDIQAKVFEPFYTTKPFGHGTGLGLAVVASMIDAAGGTIEVASAPNSGTRFSIRMPLHIASRDQPALNA